MAQLYADENFPIHTVETLRELGHDGATAYELGKANQSIPDDAVLAFATSLQRVVLTINRKHFIRLHMAMLILRGLSYAHRMQISQR